MYIRLKNSWGPLSKTIIDITTCGYHNGPHNPKHPINRIVLDFKNREEIIKYGVKCESLSWNPNP